MKIGIYNPYLHSLSGGERYTALLAAHWSNNHDVTLFWDQPQIKNQIGDRLNIDMSRVLIRKNIFRLNLVQKLKETKKYDVMFVLSDGSIPLTFASKNIIHFQMPFRHIPQSQFKLRLYRAIVYNSHFTHDHISLPKSDKDRVIYPPVTTKVARPAQKQKIILTVGRISPLKKADFLIAAFARAQKNQLFEGWKFIIAGGLLETDQSYLNNLMAKSQNLNIEILTNIDNRVMQQLFTSASIYWHAAGYRENNPERMEHFGISTVEAMAAGCVPVVAGCGGLPEIVTDNRTGFLFTNTDDLLEKTEIAIRKTSDRKFMESIVERAKDFDESIFCRNFDRLLREICL